MTVEQWSISETAQFRDDVLHFGPSDAAVRSWRENVRRHPLIGTPAEDRAGIGEYDYDVGDFVIRYVVIPERRHVILMVLRPREEDGLLTAKSIARAWRLAQGALRLWRG